VLVISLIQQLQELCYPFDVASFRFLFQLQSMISMQDVHIFQIMKIQNTEDFVENALLLDCRLLYDVSVLVSLQKSFDFIEFQVNAES